MNTEAMILMSKTRSTSHIFHLIMSILTVGFWIPVWMLCGLNNWIENKRIYKKVRKLDAKEIEA